MIVLCEYLMKVGAFYKRRPFQSVWFYNGFRERAKTSIFCKADV